MITEIVADRLPMGDSSSSDSAIRVDLTGLAFMFGFFSTNHAYIRAFCVSYDADVLCMSVGYACALLQLDFLL